VGILRILGRCAIGIGAAYALVLRSRQLAWGATPLDRARRFPGDDLVPDPDLVATRAITIAAPAAEVWPWIAQLGRGRGGFYSYDWLENLFGCHIHSADRVVPGWQDVSAGDTVKLAPEVGLDVSVVEPGRALVLRGGVTMGTAGPPYDFTWAFVVEDLAGGTSRLLIRERYGYERWWAPLIVEPVEVVSFVMHRKMLRGIRARAEA
jgi:hypothetical protein